ncbi:MAG: response regulator [Gaiellaceae bacterium]|jgi:signal transduction histidine kinase
MAGPSKGRSKARAQLGGTSSRSDDGKKSAPAAEHLRKSKSARQELNRATRRFVGGFEHTPVGMAVVDATGQYLEVNPALCHVEVIARCERGEDGKPTRVIGTVQDVTERVEAEAARRQLEAQMQEAQRLESLGVLAGGIAHDFNNLLVGILGNAGLAAMELPPGAPAKLLIDQIEIAARRAAELTKQMLAYSGRGQFVVRLLDMREVVREIAALLESAISKDVRITYELADELPAVRADVAQMRQLIMNLITNASDAIGEKSGEITLEIGTRTLNAAELATYALAEGLPEGPYVSIEIADTGAGMDAETLSKIFDPFFTTKFSGHGLGLAAALGIVRGHHGAIKVASEPGKGSRFSLLFPAVYESPVESKRTSVDLSWKGSGTILVVDDEEIVRRAAHRILGQGGLTVVEVSSGQAALDLFRVAPDDYDAALIDIVMPGMSGAELLEALRSVRPELPVILSSGYDARALAENASSLARTYFLQKPYHARDLLDCTHKALGVD